MIRHSSALILVLILLCSKVFTFKYKNTAIIFSGGGSRIGQQLAMLASLFTGANAGHVTILPNFIAGSSAGSISAVLANALYRSVLDPSFPSYNLDKVDKLLRSINNSRVMDLSPSGLKNALLNNVLYGYLISNEPLCELLSEELDSLNFRKLKDLYIPTCIAVTDVLDGKSYNLCSDDPEVNFLSLVDVIMASVAIPVLFKPKSLPLPKSYGSGTYMDGSFSQESIPISTTSGRDINSIYLIIHSNNNNSFKITPAAHHNYLYATFNLLSLTASLVSSILDMNTVLLLEIRKHYRGGPTIYLFQPSMYDSCTMINFDSVYKQYVDTLLWTIKNKPVCLNCDKY